MKAKKITLMAIAMMVGMMLLACAKKGGTAYEAPKNIYTNHEKGFSLALPPTTQWEDITTGASVDKTLRHSNHLSIIVINSMVLDMGGLTLPMKDMASVAFDGFKQGAADTRFTKGHEQETRMGTYNYYVIHFDADQGDQHFVGDMFFTFQSGKMLLIVLYSEPIHYNADNETLKAIASSLTLL